MAMDTADHLRAANPWTAEPDPVKLAILGKLAEELGELTQAAARCIIQGLDAAHPVTGKPNLDWLTEEAVDVQNMLDFVMTRLACDAHIDVRYNNKNAHINYWLATLESPSPPQVG